MLEIPALPSGVHLRTLPNGLVVIVREDFSAPVVAAQAWCKAGSIDEGRWLGAGLSHVLEHMLFKGTSTRAAGRIDQEVQAAGGYLNAFTSFDRTVYWINVPNTGARVAIDILCDIAQNASLPAEELGKEMDVIRREMDMCHDDPGRRASQRLFETAYTHSPYRYTIIGYPDIFNRLQREDVLAYYREKYVPNNLFLVVAGAVRAADVFAQIEAAFAGAKARPLPAVPLPEEPRQVAPREVIEEASIELGHVHWSWHVPDVRHPDLPLLDVLATLLGSGRSSRLFQEVRERQGLVTSVEAWTYSPGQAGLIGISAVLEADKFGAARDAVLAEVERVREAEVTGAELAKAVKQFTAAFLATRKTMQGQAQDLGGNWMAAGDLSFSERYLVTVKRATPADLLRVARTYLTAENRTQYALLPKGMVTATATVATEAEDHPVQLTTLGNGLRLLVKEDHRLPFVEFRLVLLGGVLVETPAQTGISQLFTRLLMQGTETRSAAQVATEIESVGGHLETYGGNNSFGLTAEVLREDLPLGLELLADVLLHPALPAEALERERQNQIAGIRAQKDHVLQSAFRAMRRALFGEQGYGLDLLGEEESVARLSRDDLRQLHQRLVMPRNAVLAVHGDVQPEEIRARVDSVLGSWAGGPPPAIDAGKASFALGQAPLRVEETRDKKQAVLVVAFPGLALHDPDRFALELLQEACSDLGSRLFLRIREKLGLAYYVGAQHFVGLVPGFFAFYAGTAPEEAARVEAELLAEAALLRAEGLAEEELSRAKAKIIGQKKIARQDLGGCALTSALDELYGLGYAYSDTEDERFEAVTREQVRAVANRVLTPGRHVVVVVRPEGA
jgi:zinc protease